MKTESPQFQSHLSSLIFHLFLWVRLWIAQWRTCTFPLYHTRNIAASHELTPVLVLWLWEGDLLFKCTETKTWNLTEVNMQRTSVSSPTIQTIMGYRTKSPWLLDVAHYCSFCLASVFCVSWQLIPSQITQPDPALSLCFQTACQLFKSSRFCVKQPVMFSWQLGFKWPSQQHHTQPSAPQ